MKTAKRYAEKVYNYLNEEYFDGVLPSIDIYCVNTFEFIAAATKKAIYFNDRKFLTYDYVEIMLHEMCHTWQFMHNYEDEHGETFQEIALDVSQRSGYTIEEFQNYFADEEFLIAVGEHQAAKYLEIFKIMLDN